MSEVINFNFLLDEYYSLDTVWNVNKNRIQWFAFCIDSYFIAFVDETGNSAHSQWFLSTFSDFQDRLVPAFNAVLPENPKITGIQYWFSALSFKHDFSRFSESLDSMYCRWTLLRSSSARYSYLKIGEPLPFFTSEKVCLFKIHFLYCIVNKIQIYEIYNHSILVLFALHKVCQCILELFFLFF